MEDPTNVFIVEEQLVGLNSHHFGQISDLARSAQQCGVTTTILCGRAAPLEVSSELDAEPVLEGLSPATLKARFRGPLFKLCALLLGIARNTSVLIKQVRKLNRETLVFLPTAWIPHIVMLIPVALICRSLVCGFRVQFLSRWDPARLRSRIDLQILRFLLFVLTRIHPDVRIYGQTPLVCEDIRGSSSLKIDWLPEPSHLGAGRTKESSDIDNRITVFGSYGFARHEQGTHVFQSAIRMFQERNPSSAANFRILWPCGNFSKPDCSVVSPDLQLEESGKVKFFQEVLSTEEILDLLDTTDWIVLPYRMNDYKRRSSLLAVDAVCRGIPAIYTAGTFLEELFGRFGAGISIPDFDEYELSMALERAESESSKFQAAARLRAPAAITFFSPAEFWKRII